MEPFGTSVQPVEPRKWSTKDTSCATTFLLKTRKIRRTRRVRTKRTGRRARVRMTVMRKRRRIKRKIRKRTKRRTRKRIKKIVSISMMMMMIRHTSRRPCLERRMMLFPLTMKKPLSPRKLVSMMKVLCNLLLTEPKSTWPTIQRLPLEISLRLSPTSRWHLPSRLTIRFTSLPVPPLLLNSSRRSKLKSMERPWRPLPMAIKSLNVT
mmetsp:Transcript_32318/g.78600  ORF Transcript_32318/g.78600 Transcript_32318/m.78600 type:complete len:208 (+) Transcript_32318:615-1238(+)